MLWLKVHEEEYHTIIAALRYYQEGGQGDPFNRSDRIHDIATNVDEVTSLDDAGIDELIERLQFGDDAELKVFLKYWDIDRHDDGCDCGLCNFIGKSYGVAIIELGTGEPLDVVYAASEESAFHNARLACQSAGYQIVLEPEEPDPYANCGHDSHEDHLICAECGRCDESLDEDDVCDECRRKS